MQLKIAHGCKENGIVVGNAYNKYDSNNPIVNLLMRGFEAALSGFIVQACPQSIHEIGCGEGYWVLRWHEQGLSARGCDFSGHVIEIARENAQKCGFPLELFKSRSLYDLDAKEDKADLIVCCEVLEHLEHPDKGLQALQRVVGHHLLLSVPREPIWRILNMARGKYLSAWGNTPGHIQHWTTPNFIKLVSRYFEIIEIKCPLPWTILFCRPYI